jgi:protein ImuB
VLPGDESQGEPLSEPPLSEPPLSEPPLSEPPLSEPPLSEPPLSRTGRVLAIWLPRWPVQRRLLERPEWRRVPVFVCRRGRRNVMTVVSWAWAEPPRSPRPGSGQLSGGRISPGMSLAEAMAVLALTRGSRACHIAEIIPDDPVADRSALDQLARWCRRFSPSVTVAEDGWAEEQAGGDLGLSADLLYLDVTATAGFFGGEEQLVRTVVWNLAARGLHARAAIADTPAAAFAAVHFTDRLADEWLVTRRPSERRQSGGRPSVWRQAAPRAWWTGGRRRRWLVVPPGEAATRLAELPVAALRLDANTRLALREVGVETIGGVLKLPAKSLASRFPAQLARRRDALLGRLQESVTTRRALGVGADELPQAAEQFDVSVAARDVTIDMLADIVERLMPSCVQPLAVRGEGVLALQVRLESGQSSSDMPAAGSRSASGRVIVDVRLFRPSVSVRHLVELVRLRLGRIRPPRELSGVTVEVLAAGAAVCRQRSLFGGAHFSDSSHCTDRFADTAESRAVAVGMLLDRLAGRLGRSAVFEPRPVADPQPEHAWLPVAPGVGSPGASPALAGRRPVCMCARPIPLEQSLAIGPEGPPGSFRIRGRQHVVVAVHGPERIETAWWRGPTVRRDYYVIETESGERFWVFRHLRGGGWFLHGVFA